jgi:hypothetical protein
MPPLSMRERVASGRVRGDLCRLMLTIPSSAPPGHLLPKGEGILSHASPLPWGEGGQRPGEGDFYLSSMPEMAHAGKDHGHVVFIGGSDDFGIAH